MTDKIVQPSDLHPQQINILLVSAVRALIRKGLIQKEELLDAGKLGVLDIQIR